MLYRTWCLLFHQSKHIRGLLLFKQKGPWLKIQGHIDAPLESKFNTVLDDVQQYLLVALSISSKAIEHKRCFIFDMMLNIETLLFRLDLKEGQNFETCIYG